MPFYPSSFLRHIVKWFCAVRALRSPLLIILSVAIICPIAQRLAAGESGPEREDTSFVFSLLAEVPIHLRGAILSSQAGNLLLAGGYDSDNQAHPEMLLLPDGGSEWVVLGSLAEHRAYAGVVNAAGGTFVIGGEVEGRPVDKVQRWILRGAALEIVDLPNLPEALSRPAATLSGRFLYVAGGLNENGYSDRFYRLEWNRSQAEWEALPTWPGVARAGAVLIPAIESLYLIGGIDDQGSQPGVYAYHSHHGWRVQEAAPYWGVNTVARRLGDSHVFMFSGQRSDEQGHDGIYVYHTITDTWIPLSRFPGDPPAFPKVTEHAGNLVVVSDRHVWSIEVLAVETNYGWLDHIAVLIYLGGMVLMGVYFTSRRKNTKDFFRGGNQIPWWATGMSLFATGASAISLLAMPGKSYSTDWTYFAISICSIATLPISMFLLAPLVRKLNFATANEYLDHRFGVVARTLASGIYIFTQIFGRMGPVMLLPSIAMSAITGIDISVAIIVMGVTVTLYTFLGGLSAVVWTDTVQGFVMIAAVTGCLVLVFLRIDLNPGEIMETLRNADKLHTFDWGWEITYPTIWMIFMGTVVLTLGGVGDQNYIQRVQCTPTLKDAQKAVATQMAVAVPINVLLFSLGTALYLFYRQNPEMLNPVMKTDGIFPFFAAQQLPPGVSGLVVAALLAATMSTISSSVCSVANLGVDDFYRRFHKNPNDRTAIVLGRWLTLSVGVVGIGAALFLAQLSMPSIWDMALLVTNLISNGIVGLFALGLLTRRAHQWGALLGVISGMVSVYFLQNHTEITFWLFMVIGSTVTFVCGYFFSLIIPAQPKALSGLTVYTLREKVKK